MSGSFYQTELQAFYLPNYIKMTTFSLGQIIIIILLLILMFGDISKIKSFVKKMTDNNKK